VNAFHQASTQEVEYVTCERDRQHIAALAFASQSLRKWPDTIMLLQSRQGSLPTRDAVFA